jgi:hypothetical protein
MTSRKSSGSMRADRAVEPTKSENITVTWRRSAASCGFGLVSTAGSGVAGGALASWPMAASNIRRCPSKVKRGGVAAGHCFPMELPNGGQSAASLVAFPSPDVLRAWSARPRRDDPRPVRRPEWCRSVPSRKLVPGSNRSSAEIVPRSKAQGRALADRQIRNGCVSVRKQK